eukprot:5793103-Ditylum_brightwellii.AAC.1
MGEIGSAVDPAIWKLKTSNPKQVDNYMDALEVFFTNQNILTRALQLQQDFLDRTHDLSVLINRYEQLDRIITKGMLSVEKSCCKSKHGYAWLIKLVRAGKL